ncbi:MAG: peptidylprolyl isomerase [Sphingomonas sp.]
MNRRFALAALLALFALPAIAATPKRKPAPPARPAPLVLADTERVVLTTDLGDVTLELDARHAPITVRNFVTYVVEKRYDGTSFYRSMRLPGDVQPYGLIQGGTQNDPKRTLPPIAHEPTSQTGILHKAWAISMARYEPGTATGDFSILLADLPGLDATPGGTGDTAGYAAFGHVVAGQDVVRKIWDSPLSLTRGEGFLKGQMIEAPVRIITARRLPPTAPIPPATP